MSSTKEFKLYSDIDLYPDQEKFTEIIEKNHIPRDQDEDIDTDEEVLKLNKKQCFEDLKSGINDFLNGNPYYLIRNLR